MNEWTQCLDDRKSIDVCTLIIRRHLILAGISKLQAYGIHGNLLTWIHNFLNNRRQRVYVRGSFSDWSQVISGVPQGSVLGPILFIIYINDLSDHIQSSSWTFADDTKIYRPILTSDDHHILQNNLNTFMEWNRTWQGFMNISKCKHLSIGDTSNVRSYTFTIYLENVRLMRNAI